MPSCDVYSSSRIFADQPPQVTVADRRIIGRGADDRAKIIVQAGYRRHHGSGINLYADLIACHLIGCGKHFAWDGAPVQRVHEVDAVIAGGERVFDVFAACDAAVVEVDAVAGRGAWRPFRVDVAVEGVASVGVSESVAVVEAAGGSCRNVAFGVFRTVSAG